MRHSRQRHRRLLGPQRLWAGGNTEWDVHHRHRWGESHLWPAARTGPSPAGAITALGRRHHRVGRSPPSPLGGITPVASARTGPSPAGAITALGRRHHRVASHHRHRRPSTRVGCTRTGPSPAGATTAWVRRYHRAGLSPQSPPAETTRVACAQRDRRLLGPQSLREGDPTRRYVHHHHCRRRPHVWPPRGQGPLSAGAIAAAGG